MYIVSIENNKRNGNNSITVSPNSEVIKQSMICKEKRADEQYIRTQLHKILQSVIGTGRKISGSTSQRTLRAGKKSYVQNRSCTERTVIRAKKLENYQHIEKTVKAETAHTENTSAPRKEEMLTNFVLLKIPENSEELAIYM